MAEAPAAALRAAAEDRGEDVARAIGPSRAKTGKERHSVLFVARSVDIYLVG